MGELPLHGLKILDFTRVLAGPHCAKTLLDLGADVTKVEPPGLGDISRYAAPGQPGKSHYFYQQNAGKKCISVDLNFPEGQDIIRHLLKTADVVIENFRPGTLDHFGLSYEEVAEINPQIIYVSISGYGQKNSMSHRGAFAPTVHAEVGLVDTLINHYGDNLGEPSSDVFSHADVYTGMEAVIATLAALEQRHRTGKGQHVDVAMAATMMYVNERAHADLTETEMDSEPPALGATESPTLKFREGQWIVISASPIFSPIFVRYCAMMRRNDLRNDPRFKTAELRRLNLKALLDIVQSWVYSFQSIEELEVHLTEAGLAVGEVRTSAEFGKSQWAEEWGAVVEVVDDHGATVKLPGQPWQFSESTRQYQLIASSVGEDNWSVLSDAGVSAEQFSDLQQKGVIYSVAPFKAAAE
ncbi:CoA transferase [Sneathiella sp. P13V-1]|uniref:CaiB/BaiF CoA transferase family protein n=1 Tax=Sneathiella sp. P13V-1 TaxID=2697366 RepID=UPI00187B4DC6|nr:CoA transferase [Sneathiella sp. P13V-1]MBE7635291.1 CoA transferase [Sneathiella sp. P13V-1]